MNPKYSLIVSFLLHPKGLFVQLATFSVRTESRCVPTGSSLTLWSRCKYPDGHIFYSMSWKHRSNNVETVADPSKDSRYIYINYYYICYLIISGLKESDNGSYYMSFTYTNGNALITINVPTEVVLHVTDLQVTVDSERVTEGQNVTLTCKTSCPLTFSKRSFIWWKKETRLDRHQSGDALHVSAVSREDSGRYSCAMEGYERFRSNETLLTVNPPDVTVMERAGMLTLWALLTLITLLLICATLWMMVMMIRKKPQSLKKPEGKEKNKQNDTKDSTVTFDLEEKVKPEEVQYCQVHFIRFPNTQTCAGEADVLYSEIAVLPSSDRRSNCRK